MMLLYLLSPASWLSWGEGNQVPLPAGLKTPDRQWAVEDEVACPGQAENRGRHLRAVEVRNLKVTLDCVAYRKLHAMNRF